MFLSKSKQEFTISKIIEFINKCNTYELTKLSCSSTFRFKIDSWNSVKVEYANNLLERVEIETIGGIVSLYNEKSLQKRFEDIDIVIIKRATELDNIRFLKIFPDYTTVEDRDYKLAELLGDDNEEIEEIESPKIVKKDSGFFNYIFRFFPW